SPLTPHPSPITGIIAEFNPLHKGHEKLIQSVKENSEACVVVLSSNFTQRGEPAIVDKFLRADMAVKAGADLVVELPFLFACSAAQDFSRGAVGMLARMKFITRIACGMETPGFDFIPLIDIDNNESYKIFLRSELDKGASFSKAHALAAERVLPGSREFLTKPNNLLALSYASEIRKNNYPIEMEFVKREGTFKSKDIRKNLNENIFMVSDFSREILLRARRSGLIANGEKFWPLLQSIFIRTPPEEFTKIHGIDEGIENLFLKQWRKSESLEDFIGRCVCARYTRAHIRRRLIYILMNVNRYEAAGALRNSPPCARVLAFNATGRRLLRNFSHTSDIKFITRMKDARSRLEKIFASLEFRASRLYELSQM
ncbi:MAG: nucleotidyltransferase family protein, partial [Synergistaceae bacterium]|nr:nucleotidyltransferase family protein [Synergistaceae bacterium]